MFKARKVASRPINLAARGRNIFEIGALWKQTSSKHCSIADTHDVGSFICSSRSTSLALVSTKNASKSALKLEGNQRNLLRLFSVYLDLGYQNRDEPPSFCLFSLLHASLSDVRPIRLSFPRGRIIEYCFPLSGLARHNLHQNQARFNLGLLFESRPNNLSFTHSLTRLLNNQEARLSTLSPNCLL